MCPKTAVSSVLGTIMLLGLGFAAGRMTQSDCAFDFKSAMSDATQLIKPIGKR